MTSTSNAPAAVGADELKLIVENLEQINLEKDQVNEAFKGVLTDAKNRGYDTKVIRRLIAIRKRDKDAVAEEDSILELYKSALGMT